MDAHLTKSKRTIQALAYEKTCYLLSNLKGQHILEVGAGSGRLSQQLADDGALVTALDLIDPPHLDHANASFVQHDLTEGQLPFDEASFDAVISTEVIEHMKAPFLLLGSMVRVLKPGGCLILTMPNYWNIKYRMRYLLTGNIPMPVNESSGWKQKYLTGYAPHINVLTWPTLYAVLSWEGCESFEIDTSSRFRFYRRMRYLPAYLLVKLNHLLTGRDTARKLLLADTNSDRILFGNRHVLLTCRRNAVEAKQVTPPESQGLSA